MPDFSLMKLGRLPHDPALLARAPSLRGHAMALAPPRSSLSDRASVVYAPKMDRNDAIGDCGAVGIANGARADAALAGFSLDIPTKTVVGLYGRFGYREGQPATDNGVVLLEVLQSLAMKAWQAGPQLPLIGPFATLDPHDRMMTARVMERVGWCYAGFSLALADQQAAVWDTDTIAAQGDPTPGSWGLHCADMLYYDGLGDTDLVYIATWGITQRATWRWVRSRIEEAHAVIWRPLAGINYDSLRADVESFEK